MKKTVGFIIVLAALAALAVSFFLLKILGKTPEKTCEMATPDQSIIPAVQPEPAAKDPVPASQVIGMVIPGRPESKTAPAAAGVVLDKKPQTKTVEKMIKSGNQGYLLRDKEYVYFGITKKLIEEILSQ